MIKKWHATNDYRLVMCATRGVAHLEGVLEEYVEELERARLARRVENCRRDRARNYAARGGRRQSRDEAKTGPRTGQWGVGSGRWEAPGLAWNGGARSSSLSACVEWHATNDYRLVMCATRGRGSFGGGS